MNTKIKTGLFGFGTVGQGVYKIIKEANLPFEIKKICVRDTQKSREVEASLLTFDPQEILEDEEIELIVEVISDSDSAWNIVAQALQKGKAVVTANKKMVAENLEGLLRLQEQYHNPKFRFEAAVAAAIPILNLLDDYFAHEPLKSVRGILNGSSNFILSKMYAEAQPYEEALKEARQKGFAEADPTLDVSGQDARNKLSLIALLAFGKIIPPHEIPVQGIDTVSAKEIGEAKDKNQKIKQIAEIMLDENQNLNLSVTPQLISANDPLFSVDEEYNAVLLEGQFSGTQKLYGKGAGEFPTGTAVVADMLAIAAGKYYRYEKLKPELVAG
jgi:homoserine dehydrogenase